jgi:chromate reductase, NAD(P)H dehydrogenase (quinone)
LPIYGQQHLSGILALCNSPQLNAVEASIQFAPGLITDDGEVTDETVAEFLRNYLVGFHAFIARVFTALLRNA